jgi:hypothetical protein
VDEYHHTLAISPRSASEPVKVQVAIDAHHAVVPVENQVALLDGPQPGHTELNHRLKVPKVDDVNE